MADFIIRPSGETDWTNGTLLSGNLPISNQDIVALGLSIDTAYEIARIGDSTTTFTVTSVQETTVNKEVNTTIGNFVIDLSSEGPAENGAATYAEEGSLPSDVTLVGDVLTFDTNAIAAGTVNLVVVRTDNNGTWRFVIAVTLLDFGLNIQGDQVQFTNRAADTPGATPIAITPPSGNYSGQTFNITFADLPATSDAIFLADGAIEDSGQDGTLASGEAATLIRPPLSMFVDGQEPATTYSWRANDADLGDTDTSYTGTGSEAGAISLRVLKGTAVSDTNAIPVFVPAGLSTVSYTGNGGFMRLSDDAAETRQFMSAARLSVPLGQGNNPISGRSCELLFRGAGSVLSLRLSFPLQSTFTHDITNTLGFSYICAYDLDGYAYVDINESGTWTNILDTTSMSATEPDASQFTTIGALVQLQTGPQFDIADRYWQHNAAPATSAGVAAVRDALFNADGTIRTLPGNGSAAGFDPLIYISGDGFRTGNNLGSGSPVIFVNDSPPTDTLPTVTPGSF